jgi:hypothetical protein
MHPGAPAHGDIELMAQYQDLRVLPQPVPAGQTEPGDGTGNEKEDQFEARELQAFAVSLVDRKS